ncbi:MAG: glutathione S-transferase family protein [Rhizobiales bacterium]|nr:glutathione S-transferase family protein [Hyphomicrobiales bacterium]
MTNFKLYCFGESGNAYKAALMLQACGVAWEPVFVDFFNGETRSDAFRRDVNIMGEVPVLKHENRTYSQSGVILDYLAEVTRKFGAKSEDERREILRWMLFDNHKLTASIASLRYLLTLTKKPEGEVTEYLRKRALGALAVVNAHLADRNFIMGKRATIADFSLCGYLYYGDELPFDLEQHTHVMNWLDRIRALPGWKHPYDLMPRKA